MSLEDIDSLVYSEQNAQGGKFIYGVTVSQYLSKLKSKAEFVVHYCEGVCAGFVAYYCNDLEKENAFITLVLISPDFRGRGLASELIDYTLRVCVNRKFKTCSLEVHENNEKAIDLYRMKGFFAVENKNKKILMSLNLSKRTLEPL